MGHNGNCAWNYNFTIVISFNCLPLHVIVSGVSVCYKIIYWFMPLHIQFFCSVVHMPTAYRSMYPTIDLYWVITQILAKYLTWCAMADGHLEGASGPVLAA